MRFRTALAVGSIGAMSFLGLLRAQKPFKEYPAIEYEDFALPPDWKDQQHEWVRARLRYPDIYGYPDHSRLRMQFGRPWPGQWTMDYPRSDRHLLAGVRRLTRIDTRSVEQVVDLDGNDDVYNWPLMYAVEVGHWLLGPDEVKQLREYLLRGGFLMVDDFHGSEPYPDYATRQPLNEWETFVNSIGRVFPERSIEDISDSDPIFHTLFDLEDRFQVPGAQYFETGITYEKGPTGRVPHWRCIRDDKGRIMVAICHNMDLGDAWEWSDDHLRTFRRRNVGDGDVRGWSPRSTWAGSGSNWATQYLVSDLTICNNCSLLKDLEPRSCPQEIARRRWQNSPLKAGVLPMSIGA